MELTIDRDKNEIVREWLSKKDFFNIEISSNRLIMKADAYNSRILVVIGSEVLRNNKLEILEYAMKTHRKVWVVNVNRETNGIEWEMFK
ncbi:hypothetical protein [Paenimyroides baculatum]|uniref:Uncharacterized protein n=1 Tax=Paenimyroides baculatum TaxID=2608000 RepID=A0A5M6CHS5_9FLAO|nr:hypothetical protein [Paenimyroides baculatum]KAA5533970.1 hypothetical protein F0460_11595 [Paenimyroides baculatum]